MLPHHHPRHLPGWPPACRRARAYACSQVKAQIKLKLTTMAKKPAVVTRSFSLTQKPQKREYKAFESSMRTIDTSGQSQVGRVHHARGGRANKTMQLTVPPPARCALRRSRTRRPTSTSSCPR